MLSFRRPLAQLAAAALLGALVMALADWAARTLFFPWQLPAGLVATLLGSLFLPWLMARR
jgi:ferric hydroxamate transport system permease protein